MVSIPVLEHVPSILILLFKFFCINCISASKNGSCFAAAPSPYLPGTPGGPPMTPGVPSYLPGTPGGQPMTPGTGGLDPTSPAIGKHIVNYDLNISVIRTCTYLHLDEVF